ncbi:MAG TPA: acetyl-CoA carboxylase biotin carboxyl carrier protein [Terriglobia bacterium]|nr:acetyl-CoA carboxylase biotin carboxyl carrier protein [Terriglobia bacterium]
MPSKNPRGREESDHPWPLQDIEELINLLVAKEISEFELEKDGVKVRIKRAAPAAPAAAPVPVLFEPVPLAPRSPFSVIADSPGATGTSPAPTGQAGAGSVAGAVPPLAEPTEDLHIIKSPIVGTFYGSPSPNAPPFVKVGDTVFVGQILCIIEAMKLMNEIESEVEGEVARIYVESGQPVEYGELLFAVRPSRKKSG